MSKIKKNTIIVALLIRNYSFLFLPLYIVKLQQNFNGYEKRHLELKLLYGGWNTALNMVLKSE